MTCCDEYGCTRKKPFRIRKSNWADIWYVVSDYTVKDGLIHVTNKHDVTGDLHAALIDAGWTPPKEEQ